MRHAFWWVLAAILALTATPVAGQTSRPAAAAPAAPRAAAVQVDDWPGVIATFARAMRDGNTAYIRGLLGDAPTFKALDPEEAAGPDSLAARTTGAQVLGAHAYSFPPMVMAADVAADVKGAAGLSDAVRKSFVPADDDEMKRANATAVQWVAQALAPGKGTPVALIVLWDDAARDGTATPLFVLVRGVEHPDGTYKINRVVYGHPERAIQ